MNKDTFIKLFKTPAPISVSEIEDLEEVLKNFPYCQSAHIFLAKANNDKGSMFANQKVKKAALFTSSRQKLRELLVDKPVETVDEQVKQVLPIQIAGVAKPQPVENAVIAIPNVSGNTEVIIDIKPVSEEKPVIYVKPSTHEDNSALLDDIQKTLESIKKKQSEIEEKEKKAALGKIPPTVPIAENLKDDIEVAGELLKKKTSSKLETEAAGLKFYVHTSEFGKDIRPAKEDLIAEYLAYRPSTFTPKPPIEAQLSIIQKFIDESPQISRFNDIGGTVSKTDLSKNSTVEDGELVSENLANILIKQSKYKKALDVYEKLKLKYPEKTAYFAEKIEYTQTLLNK